MAQCAHFSHFQHRLPFVSLILSPEPLGGAGALWTVTIPSRFLSLTLPHPWNIMWDEGNCYGKLNEIKREKQLHSPLSCVISELSVWWSRPDGLRVWWSWQAAAPGLMGTQYLGVFSFMPVHRSLYLSSVVFSILSPALSLSLSSSVQGQWPFNYPSNSEHTNLGPQFPGVCACFSLCALSAWRVCSSVHIVRLFNRQSYTVASHQLGITFELELEAEKNVAEGGRMLISRRRGEHKALHSERLQHTLELYQRTSRFVHRAWAFFRPGSICHWEAVERKEKMVPAGKTGLLEIVHLRTALWQLPDSVRRHGGPETGPWPQDMCTGVAQFTVHTYRPARAQTCKDSLCLLVNPSRKSLVKTW